MKQYTLAEMNDLIDRSVNLTESGHPFLDARWKEEGKFGRNKHYRRQYYRFCQQLAKEANPRLVVELGIDEGDCCAHWASGNPKTLVAGVDVHKDWHPGMQQVNPVERCQHIEKLFPNFTYLRGWTWEMIPEVKKLGAIDILYIDSWHEYDYLARDWNDYAPLLNDYSIVIIDDLNMTGIDPAFNEIPGEFKIKNKSLRPQYPDQPTFGIIINPDKSFRFTYTKRDYMP